MNSSPLMVAVAPNGARKTKEHHTALPISPSELAITAQSCLEAGACMIHLHVRDEENKHSLDVDRYRKAISAVRSKVGDKMIVQVTTEAVGIYSRHQQMALVTDLKPEAVSLAVKELCPEGCDERESAQFFAWLEQENILPQYILYTSEDVRRFFHLRANGVIRGENPSVLLVLGRYSDNGNSKTQEMLPLLQELQLTDHGGAGLLNWWLCAFGHTELACMLTAAGLGGHCRVGFENNMTLYTGEKAADNQALVAQVVDNAALLGCYPATADQARQIMGKR